MATTNTPRFAPQEVWDNDISAVTRSAADWVLPGFVARGNMTLLTSLWKAGKTTLLTHLLKCRVTGKGLFDRVVAPGKSVVISEEPREMWADRCRHFDFAGTLCLFPQPFPHLPSADDWRGLLDRVAHLHSDHGVDLLVVDSVTHFLRAETASVGVLDFIMPIRALAARGMAALLMHHPRRRDSADGTAGRGHGALHSEVDISIEMRRAGVNPDSRARRFFCLSRHDTTPPRLHFELNADGSDYNLLPDTPDDGFSEQWDLIRLVLEDAPRKRTRREILADWPEDYPKPSPAALWKWLERATSAGLALVEGTGRKADPFRYWLASAEARWRKDPLHEYLEKTSNSDRMLREMLGLDT
jgi:hypothetical protein